MEPEVLPIRKPAEPPQGASPFGAEPFVLLDLAAPHEECGAPLVARWRAALAGLAVPLIGVGSHAHPLAALCDAVLDEPAAALAVARIRHTPLAAMTLVQVLRAAGALALEEALLLESLAYATLQAGPEFARWRASFEPKTLQQRDAGPAVLLTRTGDALEIRLNRPSRANAISVEMRDALVEAFELVALDASIGSAVVRANGRSFSTGGDLDEFGTTPDAATAHAVRCLRLPARALLGARERIAFEVHGACVGAGIELPAFATSLGARRDAWFELPELDYGLIPGAGGCVSIPRRIGRQRTAELALTGRRIDAPLALEWGLVDRLLD